jgi:hypothetical protein
MARQDPFNQYAQDSDGMADPLYERARAAGQYTQDVPTTTSTDYSYRNPQHPRLPQPGAQVMSSFGQGAAAPSDGVRGGSTALSAQQKKSMTGEEFQRRWRESEERVWRNQQRLDGTRPWTGHPQDYEDVLGPERSGGMETVVRTGNPITGLRKDEGWDTGTAGVPAKPNGNGNGNGLSGGAARPIPTGVGGI